MAGRGRSVLEWPARSEVPVRPVWLQPARGAATRSGQVRRPDQGERDRLRPVLWRVLALLGLAGAAYAFVAMVAARHGFFDLRVYYGALNYWVNDGGSLYDYLLPKSTYGFTYPPFAALLMVPMAVTPWTVAIVISATACVLTSVAVLYWLVDPMARRYGWTRWFALGVALCLAAAFEPLRETFLFGQVNMLLVFLVAADLVLLVGRGSRLGGVGIGIATATKLTPGIFIVYLLITKRWRAALVASATAAVATIIAAAVVPDTSRVFWTDALWNTDRVGALAFISNQSLNGAVARLNPADPSTVLWLAAVAAVLCVWLVRVRRAAAAGDEMTGFALTGIVGCLCSPITWVHHLVWVGPAIVLLLDRAMAAAQVGSRRRAWWLLGSMVVAYAVLSSRLVWSYNNAFGDPVGWLMSNSYVWVSIALLVWLPIRGSGVVAPGAVASGAVASGAVVPGALDQELAGLLTPEATGVPHRVLSRGKGIVT
jgi:alpha-1,2-mannosyltransferase